MKVTVNIPIEDVTTIERHMNLGTYLTDKEKARIFDDICSNDIILHDIDLSNFEDNKCAN